LVSPGWTRLAGQARQANGVIFDILHPDDEAGFRQQFAQLIGGEKTSLAGRMRLRRSDSKEVWIEYRFVTGDTAGRGARSVRGVMRDITQSYQLEKHVTHMALHDALTGLPNRVLLEDRCKIALRTAERNGSKVALGFMDLDHFKHVNDQFGHKAGDELLMALSNGLRQCLRAGDTLARWGGDEFVVLLTDVSGMDGASEAIAKLESICAEPIKIDGNEFNPTFSMGVAIYPDDANTVETLLSQADRAMFAAKQQGRNTVRFFADIAHREQDRKALYIQNRLATAIKEQQIQTWFQPIVDAQTLRVVNCEALARWHDESYGWVSPATFVPMAENLGLIREIGQQVWKQAIENLHRWREMGMDMMVSVNVSRRQLFTPSFTADLLEDLERLAIPVSVVNLEITESVAMEDAEHTTKRLAELTEAGFGIAIDDFGTGYSSLSQLHDMPASTIKIDISFVSRTHDEQGGQLIQAIVKIASAFKLQTVAEGVETAETAARLREFGVDKLQGYHFSKPMNAEAFERYLRANFKKG
jgi:diguanylate cyclase (GGDEF)-like protein